MSESLRIALAQLDLLVGDVQGNAARVIESARAAHREHAGRPGGLPGAHAVRLSAGGPAVPPRLPPADRAGLEEVCRQVPGPRVIVGYPEYTRTTHLQLRGADRRRRGRGHPPQGGAAQLQGVRREALLPRRRAADGGGVQGLSGGPARLRGHLGAASPRSWRERTGAELLVVINASPYERNKQREREVGGSRARRPRSACRIAYVNMVGGQDELVFDGNSFVMDAAGQGRHARAGLQGGHVLRRFRAPRPRRGRCRCPGPLPRS